MLGKDDFPFEDAVGESEEKREAGWIGGKGFAVGLEGNFWRQWGEDDSNKGKREKFRGVELQSNNWAWFGASQETPFSDGAELIFRSWVKPEHSISYEI